MQTLFRDEDRPRLTPPQATQKRDWASLSRTVEVRAAESGDATPVEICGQTEVFEHLRDGSWSNNVVLRGSSLARRASEGFTFDNGLPSLARQARC